MPATPYRQDFFDIVREGAYRSARVVIPLVLQVVPVRTVVDVGCGEASWLSVFRELGVTEVLGVDGDYVDRSRLQIPADQFQAADLTKPFRIERSFDLAMSLEVAEHLPPSCAPDFVEGLTRLAPVVLFSAAIPFQKGTHHVNEQWPNYWADLFERHAYRSIDNLRGKIWENENVDWWYAQNLLLFANEAIIRKNDKLRSEFERSNYPVARLIHPKQYLRDIGIRDASRNLADALKRSILWRVGRR